MPDEYTPISIKLIDATKSNIAEAATTIADNDAEQGNVLLADGNRKSIWSDLDPSTVKLPEDLYTYADIGKVTGASNTHPVKVGSQGDSLDDVFKVILGEQQDQDPGVITNLSVNIAQTGQQSIDGSEVGTIIPAQSIQIQITSVNHSGIASYGVNYGNNQSSYSKTIPSNLNYPLNNLDFKLTADSQSTYDILKTCTFLVGSLISRDDANRTLNCSLNDNTSATIQLSLPQINSTSSEYIRLGTITISGLRYLKAQYNSYNVNYFYTFLGNQCTTSGIDHKKNSGSFNDKYTTQYKVTAGQYYPYWYASPLPQITSLNKANKIVDSQKFFLQKSSGKIISGSDSGKIIQTDSNGYIWIFISENASQWSVSQNTKLYQYAMGQWNELDTYIFSTYLTLDSGKIERCYALRTAELLPNDWQIGVSLT